MSQGVARGPRAGFVTAMGLASGNLVHTVAAALGISVVFRTSAIAFDALKFAGAAYLLYLAWNTVRSGGGPVDFGTAADARRESLFWRAVLMNVLNPKVALSSSMASLALSCDGMGSLTLLICIKRVAYILFILLEVPLLQQEVWEGPLGN